MTGYVLGPNGPNRNQDGVISAEIVCLKQKQVSIRQCGESRSEDNQLSQQANLIQHDQDIPLPSSLLKNLAQSGPVSEKHLGKDTDSAHLHRT